MRKPLSRLLSCTSDNLERGPLACETSMNELRLCQVAQDVLGRMWDPGP